MTGINKYPDNHKLRQKEPDMATEFHVHNHE